MKRLERFREKLKKLGIDGAIVLNELNQHYLSGFAFTDGLLLITQNSAELITDFRYYELAQNEADEQFKVVMPENRSEYISKILSADGVKTLGFEGDFVSFNTYHAYKDRYPSVPPYLRPQILTGLRWQCVHPSKALGSFHLGNVKAVL